MLNSEYFSNKYSVRKIETENIKQVAELCRENTLFYKYCPPFATEETILDDIKALPKGKSKEDKYYVGFFDYDSLIAVMDLIDAYPDKDTAFIGFFMTNTSIQNHGIGTQIIEELSQYLKNQGYKYIKLGWVKGNYQSESFWHKNHFSETGVSYNTNGYTVIAAQKDL